MFGLRYQPPRDQHEDPGAIEVAAIGQETADKEEQEAEHMRRQMHGRELASNGLCFQPYTTNRTNPGIPAKSMGAA
jgi:hypothetical protein